MTLVYTGPQFTDIAHNLQSAFAHPSIINDALAVECLNNRIIGPFDSLPLPNLRCSRLGIVPKHDGGWRTIYHLSAPLGYSINDFIDSSTYTLSYCTVDDAYAIVYQLGPGTLLSKIDLKDAFCLISVRPADWNLLGIFWQGKYCLPFGLRSAPCIFDRLTTAIHWILQHNYRVQFLLHYLDDFLTAGPPQSPVCRQNLEFMLHLCHQINAPIKAEKVIPPSTQITFLGIVIDTNTMTASISDERKSLILEEVESFMQCKKCVKRELLSLIGKLSFACKVVQAGRIFLCRLIDLSMTVKHLHHIRISRDAQLDLVWSLWWYDFLPSWSGSSLILDIHWTTSSDMKLYIDASGTEGWDAFRSGRWLQACWSPSQADMVILWKELFAIVSAVNSWGHQWAKQKILFHCDNEAVVTIWRKGSTRDPETMALVCLLYFCAARYNINIVITHISGIDNSIADSLSRFQQHRFQALAPAAHLTPDPICAWPTPHFLHHSSNLFTLA